MRSEKPPALKGLDEALSRLHLASSGSTRAARRKDAATAKMNPRSRKHAARFLEAYYAQDPSVDPGIGISERGLVTLSWVIFRSEAIGWITLTIAADNSYELVVVRHLHQEKGGGDAADHRLAQRIARLAEDDDGICAHCGQHTLRMSEYYDVHDDNWAEARTDETESMRCIGCLGTRIGKTLEPSDFSDARDPEFQHRSARLSDRIGHARS